MLYRVVTDDPFTLLAWSETQNGLPVEKENPHGSFKFGSKFCARPCKSETRFVCWKRLLPALESTSRRLQGFDLRAGAPHFRA